DGNIWVPAQERQAIVLVTKNGKVNEVFRNPVNLSTVVYGKGLRNAGDQSVGNNHILETPSTIFLTGTVLCVAQPDANNPDNVPRAGGDLNASEPPNGAIPLGNIS